MSAKEHDHDEHHDDHAHDHAGDHAHDHPVQTDEVIEPIKPTEHGFWRSLRELDGKASFQLDPARARNEFPTEPSREIDPMHRRNFFQLMGASMALAGVAGAGCRYEKEEIVPLARRPEDQTPGITQQYATAADIGGIGHALIATAFEGRPIHLDGNPEHPYASGGAVPGTQRHAGISTFVAASILNMYDPDRSQNPTSGGKGASMETFRAALPDIRKNLGTTRVLSESTSSPTVAYLKQRLLEANPGLQWHEYEPISWDNEREGTRRVFGQPARPIARLDKCETIVTVDCDLFVEHPAAMRYSRDFSRSRRMHGSLGIGKMNRLWSAESLFTNTGAMADHRLGLRAEHGLPFVMALGAAITGGPAPQAEFLKEAKVAEFVRVLAAELVANHGKSVIVAGRRQPPEVHALVASLNQALGAPGATLDYVYDPDPNRRPHAESIAQLGKDMAGGRVNQLIIIGGNPVYDAPVDLDFAGALGRVANSIHLHEYQNETSKKTTWHVPKAHFLESWGDVRTWDGTITIAQPLLAPMYGGISTIEMLSLLLGEEKIGDQLVQDAHAKLGITAAWRQSVHDGFVPNTQLAPVTATAGNFAPPPLTPSQLAGSKRANGDLEVVWHYSYSSYDGRFANNAWLQETPDFLTKVTWDNYALVGHETAKTLGLENDTFIEVTVEGRKLELPCYVMPSQARYTIGLVLGGGRTAAGRVGGQGDDHVIGVDVNKLRSVAGFDIAQKASARGTGRSYPLASVQEHWDIRTGIVPSVNQEGIQERLPQLVRTVDSKTLANDKRYEAEEASGWFTDPKRAGNNDGPVRAAGLSLFKEKDYTGHRWGMAIDLNTCTGCNACMVACQSENNVPVVGRDEIFHDREMHWIRIDRYFAGPPEDATVAYQPVACQQCEQAPCETVCPVGATSHSDEGLNDMAYNRCIGTRYCANNCPYKVRKFNFLDWNKEWREARNKVRRLIFNPDVTVRMRGVMEKCTFCVQRIQNGKIKAKAQIRQGLRPGTVQGPLPDGEIETACQEACPTEAIVFGDLSDPNSRVSKLHDDNRAYTLLPELYTKPRNQFLSRVRNPNPQMSSARAATKEG